MTLPIAAFHGCPITPRVVLEAIGERDYCVSHFRDDDLDWIEAHSRSPPLLITRPTPPTTPPPTSRTA